MNENRERDLILAPNEYAFVLDDTKGNVNVYVGPHKVSMSTTDRPVTFDQTKRKFVNAPLDVAKASFPEAAEGWYVVLENPTTQGDGLQHPKPGGSNIVPELALGRKINIPGPCNFPLWPGQHAEVVPGHHLRSNQYLTVRVYNEKAARENWDKAIIIGQGSAGASDVSDLSIGKMIVIKGTDVSFFIPPTGVEVLSDEFGNYVRDAVSLERMEYCILLDEDGNKTYVEGPKVVFPKPTQTLVTKDGSRKFLAIELNDVTGLHIKVIAAYEESGIKHSEGDELFISGKKQKIYYPRPEHAIIRSGETTLHHAVPIPKGEARYVLNKDTGEIAKKTGPCMFLPDPRKEIVVRRILPLETCELMFPANNEAKSYNQQLLAMSGDKQKFVSDVQFRSAYSNASRDGQAKALVNSLAGAAAESFGAALTLGGDTIKAAAPTKPETIVLNSKYEGAVAINVFTGYAVQVTSKDGSRKVIKGPQCYILEYDESLEVMALSTGKPKTTDKLEKTVYLRTLNNKVSDSFSVESKDMVMLDVKLSYRVNFEGDETKWFNVENYVKFLTDNLRSRLRNCVKKSGVEEFYNNQTDIIRDTLLGKADPSGDRIGLAFEENGMRVYDLEVLKVDIKDATISAMLTESHCDSVRNALTLAKEERTLKATQRQQEVKRETLSAIASTTQHELDIKISNLTKQLDVRVTEHNSTTRVGELELQAKIGQQKLIDAIEEAVRSREKLAEEQRLNFAQKQLEQTVFGVNAEVDAVVKKASAITPQLTEVLRSFADKDLAGKLAEAMAPVALLKGMGVMDVVHQLLAGTVVDKALQEHPKSIE